MLFCSNCKSSEEIYQAVWVKANSDEIVGGQSVDEVGPTCFNCDQDSDIDWEIEPFKYGYEEE
tara:strand:- start:314 stop:502 length:189 start_codon:yes stop_codon:yes gene_type:complete